MGEKCWFWVKAGFAGLGIFFGVSIFFIFSFHYENEAVGAFGLFSAMFAAISLHLTLLNSDNRLYTWYSPKNLMSLSALGLICGLMSLGVTIFYLTSAVVNSIPLMPAKGSYYLVAVWSTMTCKWAFTVAFQSFFYARILQNNTPFLIIQEED